MVLCLWRSLTNIVTDLFFSGAMLKYTNTSFKDLYALPAEYLQRENSERKRKEEPFPFMGLETIPRQPHLNKSPEQESAALNFLPQAHFM